MTSSHRAEPRFNMRSPVCALVVGGGREHRVRPVSRITTDLDVRPDGDRNCAPWAARGQRIITYGDWKKLCFKPGGAKIIAGPRSPARSRPVKWRFVVDIIEREGDATARLQVFCPVGMYLPKPATLTIDQGKPHDVPYTWCLTNACIAGAAAYPKMVQEMSSGQMLRLEFVNSGLLSLSTSLPSASSRPSSKAHRRRRSNRTSMNEANGCAIT